MLIEVITTAAFQTKVLKALNILYLIVLTIFLFLQIYFLHTIVFFLWFVGFYYLPPW
jgi:hypothetical protein